MRIFWVWGIAFLVFTTTLTASASNITPVNQSTDDTSGSTRTIYFPVIGAGTCATPRVIPTSLSAINTAADSPGLGFTLSPAKDLSTISGGVALGTGVLSIRVEISGTTTALPIVDYSNSNDFNDDPGPHYYMKYDFTTPNQKTFGVKLTAADGYCTAVLGGSCLAGNTGTPVPKSIKLGIVRTNNTSADPNSDFTDIQIVLVDCPPHDPSTGLFNVPTTPLSFTIIPGDQRLKLINATSPPNDVVPIQSVVVFGTNTSTQPTFSSSQIVQEFAGTGLGTLTVNGLANDTQYCFSLGYKNKGGMVSTDSTWSNNLPTVVPSANCATPSQIDGFLNRSTCFIASVAYGDEWDSRLEILRQFRDQVLEKSGAGRAFTDWYYSWSPQAAHWVLNHPVYKQWLRMALIPVVETAGVVLWLSQHLIVFILISVFSVVAVGVGLWKVALRSRRRAA